MHVYNTGVLSDSPKFKFNATHINYLLLGSQRCSFTRYLIVSKWPLAQARESGVSPALLTGSVESHHQQCIQYSSVGSRGTPCIRDWSPPLFLVGNLARLAFLIFIISCVSQRLLQVRAYSSLCQNIFLRHCSIRYKFSIILFGSACWCKLILVWSSQKGFYFDSNCESLHDCQ